MTPAVQRFAYINLILQSAGGIIAKLEDQAEAARGASLGMDVIWLTRGAKAETRASGLMVREMGPGSRLQCRMRQMRELRSLQRQYDGIVLRYPLCDPVTFFGFRGGRNVASEHHTMELPELKMNRDPRFVTERLFGPRFLGRFGGFFAVTDEILRYEQGRAAEARPGFVTYNAISTGRIPAASREGTLFPHWPRIRLVVSSPVFSPWQGLDLILEGLAAGGSDFELHVCGEVMGATKERAARMKNIVLHGRLDLKRLLEVYSKCDIGVASFGLHRKGLAEGTTLKVREYLACGLPVVLGHHDPAFPPGFRFVEELKRFDAGDVRGWCRGLIGAPKEAVFQAAEPLISMEKLVEKQVEGLRMLAGRVEDVATGR